MQNVTPIDAKKPKVLEFFAGIGLARMGLEASGFRVAWANDFEAAKMAMYERQFGRTAHFKLGDIAEVRASELPGDASVAWASSPCTDLSLAGSRAGLDGAQSGTFWHFVRLLQDLGSARPRVAVLENVVGLATSHGGDDLTAAIRAFNSLGYSVDVLSIDARRFLPQSRPRLFLVGVQDPPPTASRKSPLRPEWLDWVFEDSGLRTHQLALPEPPPVRVEGFQGLVESISNDDPRWWDASRTSNFAQSLSDIQRARLDALRESATRTFRTAYRRTRNGLPVWEVRPDDISGCLRTARGGSSKQAVVMVGAGDLRVRWMTPREYARLMGAPDYDLSIARTSQALFGFGDAVAVPAVAWLAEHYLMPLAKGSESRAESEAGNFATDVPSRRPSLAANAVGWIADSSG